MNLEKLKTMSHTEINELCAKKVMKWELQRYSSWIYEDDKGKFAHSEDDWNPTEDMNDAMMLFELNGYSGHLAYQGCDYACTLWSNWDENRSSVNVTAEADTAPLAICYASLLSIAQSATEATEPHSVAEAVEGHEFDLREGRRWKKLKSELPICQNWKNN
ncbi:MAG: Phage sandwich domain [Bacilli bacterium]|nr:Phage sandwich domain [Bacilli bacterium]